MAAKIDFSDAVFGTLEPQTFQRPPPAAPPDDEVMSIPQAAKLFGESRQTTWRRAKSGQLEEITVNGKSFVRRSEVVALMDAGKPGAQHAKTPTKLESVVASGHARATSVAVSEQISELAAAVTALQTELRSVHNAVRALLLAGGRTR